MSRNSNKQTNETTQTPSTEEPQTASTKRTRANLHTARILAFPINPYTTKYVVLSDSKVTAMFIHNMLDNSLTREYEQFGAWQGFSKYYRLHLQEFALILRTQSADAEVTETQADPFIAESFVRRYCDRMTLNYEATETAEYNASVEEGVLTEENISTTAI